jgi:hypothetical protein
VKHGTVMFSKARQAFITAWRSSVLGKVLIWFCAAERGFVLFAKVFCGSERLSDVESCWLW